MISNDPTKKSPSSPEPATKRLSENELSDMIIDESYKKTENKSNNTPKLVININAGPVIERVIDMRSPEKKRKKPHTTDKLLKTHPFGQVTMSELTKEVKEEKKENKVKEGVKKRTKQKTKKPKTITECFKKRKTSKKEEKNVARKKEKSAVSQTRSFIVRIMTGEITLVKALSVLVMSTVSFVYNFLWGSGNKSS